MDLIDLCIIVTWFWLLVVSSFLVFRSIEVVIMLTRKKPKNLLRENDAGLRLFECNWLQRVLFGRRYAVVVPNKLRPYLTTDFLWAAVCCYRELENDLAAGRRL